MSRVFQPVELKTRPDLKVFVRVLDAIDECDLRDVITKESETKCVIAAQLSGYVCDEAGKQLLPDVACALAWIREQNVKGSVCVKIIAAGRKLNEISDESLEEAEKN